MVDSDESEQRKAAYSRRSKVAAVDGPHLSPWTAVIASLTRIGEKESDLQRARRLDRRIRKVAQSIHDQSFSGAELEEFAAAAIVAFLEENRDRKLEVQSSYADYIRIAEMDKAGAWLDHQLRKKSERLRAGGRARHANDPKSEAMDAIKVEWERRHRPGAAFAREVAVKYQSQGLDISEGGIKNAIGRWRRES